MKTIGWNLLMTHFVRKETITLFVVDFLVFETLQTFYMKGNI